MKKIAIVSILLAGLQFSGWSWASGGHSPDNRVRVLLEGYVRQDGDRELIPGLDPENGGRFVASTVALVEGEGVKVMVDPGFAANRENLLDALDDADVELEDITHVFISHHHPDHTLYAGLFPNATLVDFWATYKGDHWEDHPDDYEIAPGMYVKKTPGHTLEDATLFVETPHGTVAFTHVLWFWTPDDLPAPTPDPIAEDPGALVTSRMTVSDLADCIVPGHGAPLPNPAKPDAVCVFDDDDDA